MRMITTVICPRIEYATIQWSLSKKKDKKLEKIHREATKLLPNLRYNTYKERFKRMDLITFKKRKGRRPDCNIYTMISGLEKLDRDYLVEKDMKETKGHGKNIKKNTIRKTK